MKNKIETEIMEWNECQRNFIRNVEIDKERITAILISEIAAPFEKEEKMGIYLICPVRKKKKNWLKRFFEWIGILTDK